jgi:hypothetical protein
MKSDTGADAENWMTFACMQIKIERVSILNIFNFYGNFQRN